MKYIARMLCLLAAAAPAWGMPLNSSARAVIPHDVQQIISVDYRALEDSPTALALKDRIMPDDLKRLESALRSAGMDPGRDLDQLTFAAFRAKDGLRAVGIGQGQFQTGAIQKRLRAKKVKPELYYKTQIWPLAGGMSAVWLDATTMLFGETGAVKAALDARDGRATGFNSNGSLVDLMAPVQTEPVWSILDQAGTQNMMKSALGDAANLADYDTVKKRLTASRYTMSFLNGVKFDLDVLTPDTITAASMASLMKAGMIYRKMNANAAEKQALANTAVDHDNNQLKVHFHASDQEFTSLLKSDLFMAVAR